MLIGNITANYYDSAAPTHPAPDDAWWQARQNENNALLYGPNGNQLAKPGDPGYAGLQPILPSAQPMPTVPGKMSMSNDSYRSLAGALADGYVKSATTNTGAKIAGYKKVNSLSPANPQPDISFVEFFWGDFLRNRVVWDDTKTGSALGSGQGDANLLQAPLSYFAATANGIALARSEGYRDQFGRNLNDYTGASFSANTRTWAAASLNNGLAATTDTYHMYLRDDSTIQGEIAPSAVSTNILHIDTGVGMTVAGVIKNFSSVTINGGGTLQTAWKDAVLNNFNSTLTLPAGTGKVTLTAIETYTGTTTVNAGTLALQGSASIGQSTAITIAGGAQLDVSGVTLPFRLNAPQTLTNNGTVLGQVDAFGTLGGSGVFAASVTLENGAHLAPGTSPGTLTFASGLTLGHGTVLDFDLGSSSDLVRVLGGLLTGSDTGGTTVNFTFGPGFVPGGTYTLLDWTGANATGVDTNDFVFNNAAATAAVVGSTLRATVAPEPGTASLLTISVCSCLDAGVADHGNGRLPDAETRAEHYRFLF